MLTIDFYGEKIKSTLVEFILWNVDLQIHTSDLVPTTQMGAQPA